MPFGISMKVEGVERIIGMLHSSADTMPKLSMRTLQDLTKFGTRTVQSKLLTGSRGYWHGNLRSSIHPEIRDSFYGEIVSSLSAWRSSDGYAEVIERGRAPGSMPPIDMLVPWVRDKFGVPFAGARVIAARVAHNIGIGGTEGIHMFERAVPEIERYAKTLDRPVFNWFKGLVGWE